MHDEYQSELEQIQRGALTDFNSQKLTIWRLHILQERAQYYREHFDIPRMARRWLLNLENLEIEIWNYLSEEEQGELMLSRPNVRINISVSELNIDAWVLKRKIDVYYMKLKYFIAKKGLEMRMSNNNQGMLMFGDG